LMSKHPWTALVPGEYPARWENAIKALSKKGLLVRVDEAWMRPSEAKKVCSK
jgi:hypothetical protein